MKKTCVVSCPIDTYSGYGARSRDFVKGLIKAKGDVWDIKILSQRWGSLPFGYLADHLEEDLASRTINQMTQRPDIWMQISIPNEFQKVSEHYNIGITAGIESDLCNESWIEGINRMDEVYVSSEHAKQVFKSHPKVKPTTPIKVLFEGLDTEKYLKTERMANLEINLDLNAIEESFCFLFTGHWIERKNVTNLVYTFFRAFNNQDKMPALILKTQQQSNSLTDRTRIDKVIKDIRNNFPADTKLPKVYVLQGDLTDAEMNELYNHKKVKAMVNLTRGEGFGRPLLEFTAVAKPIITTLWSGHADFLNKNFVVPVPGQLAPIPTQAANDWIVEGGKWFEANLDIAGQKMLEVWKNYSKFTTKAKQQQKYAASKFSMEKMNTLIGEYMETADSKVPEKVQLQLPKLELPKLQKIG